MAAGVCTFTETTHASVKKIKCAWVSGSGGESAVGTTTGVYDGKVIALSTVPASGGTAPSDNYDVTIADADGTDVLNGAGVDRDTANTEAVAEASLAAVAGSKLTFTIANGGNSKAGTVYLYVR